MSNQLKHILAKKIEEKRLYLRDTLKTHGGQVIGDVKLSQVFQGMRGLTSILWETSLLDPEEGIRFRGHTIGEIKEKLPKKAPQGKEPLPEGLFYLMLTGELPSSEEVNAISLEWSERCCIPPYVYQVIDAFPTEAHPMTIFSAAIMALQPASQFSKAYKDGISKNAYWEYTYEDAMNLIATLPSIAAYIYNRKYQTNPIKSPIAPCDWSAQFAHMIGYEDEIFSEFMRLYFSIHADHEGGNVSAHTSRLVGSALSDPYLCFASSMNGLAGPLHGLANQEVIKWIMEMHQELQTDSPSKEQVETYIKKTLTAGKVIPGYGHAVLRKTDPRYSALMDFAKEHIKHDATIQTVWTIYEVAPSILGALGKVKNPWPNVDAHSGAILVHYGMKEYEFYTILFGVSRALGVMSSLIWDRALSLPIERPKSTTLREIEHGLRNK